MNKITATPDQAPLFAAADAGAPLLMERDGKRYYVVAESQLEAFVSFISPRIRRQLNAVPIIPFPGFIGSGDAIRRIGPTPGVWGEYGTDRDPGELAPEVPRIG